jgi:enoyl-CoA hydratase/carnithine racemase
MAAVELTLSERRADITLARPDVLNAMNWDVFDGLAAAADDIRGDDAVRVVVVKGAGRSFSSGIDTAAFGDLAGSFDEMVARAQAGFRKIAALPMPVVAAVQGHALGAGLQLALACDLRIVAADASLGLLEARFGLLPDLCGTQRLPALVGPARAKKMIWLAERLSGVEAGAVGLADVVVPADGLYAATDELASRLVHAPPIATREVKRLVDLSRNVSLDEGMDEEAGAQRRTFSSADFSEGIAAFLAKRPPDFTGR